jgi:hypothetical protein
MDDKNHVNLVLLTYKSKALLMYKNNSAIDTEKHDWSFISEKILGGKNNKEALKKRVEKETGIKIKDIEYLSGNFYHTKLTDDDVNKIKRSEGQLLDFFTLNDIQKLKLSNQTREFVREYGNLI